MAVEGGFPSSPTALETLRPLKPVLMGHAPASG